MRPYPRSARSLAPVIALLLSTSVLGCGDGVPDFTPEELSQATAQVREAYHLLDYEFGAGLGEKWATWAPDALELKAWTVANLCGAGLDGLAEEMAEAMVANNPDSPWSSFALATVRTGTANRDNADEALDASEEALAGLPDLIDAVILREQTLFSFQDPDSATAYAATLSESQKAHPDVRTALAKTMFQEELSNLPMDEAIDRAYGEIRSRALSSYEGILEEHPFHISANLGAAQFTDDSEKATEYVRRAAGQTFSPSAHLDLWRAIQADSALSDEEKEEQISSDLSDVLERGGDSPARWAALAMGLGSVAMTELQADLEERVLAGHDDGWAAEMILENRIRILAKEIWGAPSLVEGWDAERRERLAGMLEEFLGRSRHYDPKVLLDVKWTAFLLERENLKADPLNLKRLADGVLAQMKIEPGADPGWFYSLIALTLAESPETLEDAKRVANQRMADLDSQEADAERVEVEQVEAEQGQGVEAEDTEPSTPDGAEKADPKIRAERGILLTALGQALMEEGRLDEAERELDRARELKPPSGSDLSLLSYLPYLSSGRLMEKKAELARIEGADSEAGDFSRSADAFYQEGVRLFYFPRPEMGVPWTNPNETALEALYEDMHGTLDGFEDYLSAAKDEGWEERREGILEERIADPEPAAAFVLETLDGEEVAFEPGLGKVAVINFWGTW